MYPPLQKLLAINVEEPTNQAYEMAKQEDPEQELKPTPPTPEEEPADLGVALAAE